MANDLLRGRDPSCDLTPPCGPELLMLDPPTVRRLQRRIGMVTGLTRDRDMGDNLSEYSTLGSSHELPS